MASSLYPLLLKPGIKRDGTKFQDEYCTDGQWVRFYRGLPRKIGGMQALDYANFPITTNSVFIQNNPGNSYVFFGTASGIIEMNISNVFAKAADLVTIYTIEPANTDILWQFIPVIAAVNNLPSKCLVTFGSNNLNNILDSSAPVIKYIPLGNVIGNSTDFTSAPVDTNGGMLYANPRLYAYGDNGLLRWSKNSNCFDFSGDNQNINISTDKIIFGALTKGGQLFPTMVFWTFSSVIRVSNINTGMDTEDNTLDFKIDVLSKDSSILSSRSVVEYDGIFYWPGTNRFFIYNGVILPMENNMNRRYFFDNLDMDYRQLVFGIKNVAFGEIWWFYPEKVATPGRLNVPAGTITRALIYNLEENSWYDTAINRDCGFFDNVTGDMYTFGTSLTNPSITKYFWKHEVGTNELFPHAPNNPINSYFTTPTISWGSFRLAKQLSGLDRWVQLKRIEPDFQMTNPTQNMSVVVNAQQYAQSSEDNELPTITYFNGTTEKLDYSIQGRLISFTFDCSTSTGYQMGNVMLLLNIGDAR